MKALMKIITDLIARNYNGKLIISFKDGKIQPIVRKEETIKI
jgi:hypothetical protein